MLNSRTLAWIAALLLLGGHAVLSITCNLDSSATFDEPAHIGNGASFWLTDDYRMAPEAMLLQLWLALPVVMGDHTYPGLEQPDWWKSNNIAIADQYFFQLGNDAEAMLLAGRLMNVLLGLALGLVVFAWSRRLFGKLGGLISLAAYCFCPTMLALSGLATPDMGTALFFLLALAGLWNVLHRITLWSVLGSVLAVAGLFACKMSGVLILPTGLLLLGVRLARGEPLPVTMAGRTWQLVGRGRQAAAFAALIVVHVLGAWLFLWMLFGFRYEMFRAAEPGRDAMYAGSWEETLAASGSLASVIDLVRHGRLLPEAYLYAFANTIRFSQARLAFWNGELSNEGWAGFFPYCFLVKTPLPTLLLCLLAAVAWTTTWWPDKATRWRRLAQSLYRSAPLWIFAAVYWIVSIRSRINIGHRHILPIYPVLFIWLGACVHLRWKRSWLLPAACFAWLMAESLLHWPHYLAYFNQTIGAQTQAYRHLVDGSLDWGQDLRRLRHWLTRHAEGQPVYLMYYGTANLRYYGMSPPMATPLLRTDPQSTAPPEPLRPGLYCISATKLQLQGAYINMPHAVWTAEHEAGYQGLRRFIDQYQNAADAKARQELLNGINMSISDVYWLFEQTRLSRLTAYLRQREPDQQIGGSILIYRLTDTELQAGPTFDRGDLST